MVDISFTGLASGLQVSEIVDAIVGAERAPFESRLNRRQAEITTDISAVGALKGALQNVSDSIENLASTDKYQQKITRGGDDFVAFDNFMTERFGNRTKPLDKAVLFDSKIDDKSFLLALINEGCFKEGFPIPKPLYEELVELNQNKGI